MGGCWGVSTMAKKKVSMENGLGKSFKFFCFFLLTPLALGDNLIVPKGGKELQK